MNPPRKSRGIQDLLLPLATSETHSATNHMSKASFRITIAGLYNRQTHESDFFQRLIRAGILCSAGHGLDLCDFAAQYLLCRDKLVSGLQVHPELRGCPEKLAQPYGHISADAGFLEKNVIDSLGVHIDRLGEPIARHIHGLKELMLQYLAGVNCPASGTSSSKAITKFPSSGNRLSPRHMHVPLASRNRQIG